MLERFWYLIMYYILYYTDFKVQVRDLWIVMPLMPLIPLLFGTRHRMATGPYSEPLQ